MSKDYRKPYQSNRARKTRLKKDHKGVSCGKKTPYLSEVEAQEVVDRIRRVGKARESEALYLRPYACERCGLFHIGHGPRESVYSFSEQESPLGGAVDQAIEE